MSARRTFALFVLLLAFHGAAAAAAPYSPKEAEASAAPWRWQKAPELSGHGLRSWTEAADKSVWFGVDRGALRYDGLEWTEFFGEDAPAGAEVNALCATEDGTVYAGTPIGINRYSQGRWELIFPPDPAFPFPIDGLVAASNGAVWAASPWGVLRYQQGAMILFGEATVVALAKSLAPELRIEVVPMEAIPEHPWGFRFDRPTAMASMGVILAEGRPLQASVDVRPLVVTQLAPGGPADRVGIRLGDRLSFLGPRQRYMADNISGAENSPQAIQVDPKDGGEPRRVSVPLELLRGGYRSFQAYSLIEAANGDIWVGLQHGGIVRFESRAPISSSSDRWRFFHPWKAEAQGQQPQLAQTPDGAIWAGANHAYAGLHSFTGGSWKDTTLRETNGSDLTTAMVVTRNGALWVGGGGGGARDIAVKKDGKWRTLEADEAPIPIHRALLMATSDGAVWVGDVGGEAARLEYDTGRWNAMVGLVYQDETPDGGRWFLSHDDGVVLNRDGQWTRYDAADGLMRYPARVLVTSSGEVWAAGSHDGAAATAVWDGKRWTRQTHPLLSWGVEWRGVYEDTENRLWFSAGIDLVPGSAQLGGLLVYDPAAAPGERWTHHHPYGAPESSYGIAQSRGGEMWLCGYWGTRLWSSAADPSLRPPDSLSSSPCETLYRGESGELWAGTRNLGAFRFDGVSWTHFDIRNGLRENRVRSIAVDARGSIWLVTPNQISRGDKLGWVNDTVAVSFLKNSLTLVAPDPNGGIWINSVPGNWMERGRPGYDGSDVDSTRFRAIEYHPETAPPRTRIRTEVDEVASDGRLTVSWRGDDRWNQTPRESLTYSVKLDDGPWSSFSSETSFLLDAVPPGGHVFRVRARDRDLNVEPEAASLAFTVAAPVWRQLWFLLLVAGLVGIAGRQTLRAWKRTGEVVTANYELQEVNRRLRKVNFEIEDLRARELQRERNVLHTLIDNLPDAVYIKDANGCYEFANAAHAHDLGREFPEELIGRTVLELCPPELAERFRADEQKILSTGVPLVNREDRLEGSLARPRWQLTTEAAVKDDSGKVVRLIGIARDITELKEAQNQKEDAEIRLIQSQKMEALGVLAGGIAHDFNNLLTSILGFSILAHEDMPANSIERGYLDEVITAAERARGLVQQILTFSRREKQEFRSVNLAGIVAEAIQLLRGSIPSHIEIRRDFKPDCGRVYGDPTALHQVVVNLCTNAYQAMKERGGVLTISLSPVELSSRLAARVRESDSGRCLKLTVSDTGSGINPQISDRIFEPFFTTKGAGEGTGLGLAVVHGIVTSHGGAIELDNRPGVGASFHVYLREVVDEATADEPIQRETKNCSGALLLVDDEVSVGRLGREILRRLGYDVTLENSAERALRLIEKDPGRFDALITDQMMPKMDGLELARRASKIAPGLPVVLVTGYGDVDGRPEALNPAIREWLSKPFRAADLGAAVRRALESGQWVLSDDRSAGNFPLA